jgi:uncharacterized protein
MSETMPVTPSRPSPAARAVALWILVVIVLGAAVAIALAARPVGRASTITVTGTGTAKGAPDTMTMDIGVQTTAPSAKGALATNNAQMTQLEAALLAHGLTKAGLQTSNLEIYDNTNPQGQITGFTVNDTLTATTHKLTEAGAALDAAAGVVGNDIQLNGVSFSISNQSRYLERARRSAVLNAHAAASQIAAASNTSVGAPLTIVDEESSSSPIVYAPMSFASAAGKVPVEQGTVSISVQVKVVYALH